ncbi:MAG: phosphotransferase, partial [Gammaproteobacteria bacterium]|nr:phosphotransferase [Gammaproteobacteria bacterium]MBU1442663.1 phosphotransferase [Gammaproteobacteria bacterium]
MTAPSPPAEDATSNTQRVHWSDPMRAEAFNRWLSGIASRHRLLPDSLRLASADASFRRYFRIDVDGNGASLIVMDAPPAKEDSAAFVKVSRLMAAAGLTVPTVHEWDEANGFLLLDDLGRDVMIDAIDTKDPDAARPLYVKAIDALILWQQASRPEVLPPYDRALLERELAIFPQWYVEKHRGLRVEGRLQERLQRSFALIVERNLALPCVYVHRDFMPRNLMLTA